MKLTAIQRHALYMLLDRCDNGVFSYFKGRIYAASNTFDALVRKGLVVRLSPDLFAVSRGGRAEARPFPAPDTPDRPIQMFLPLGG